MKNKNYFKNGFTLIELLLVVAIIGILAGVLTTIINPERSRKTAQEGVQQSNINKLAQGLEAYCIAENRCPAPDPEVDTGNPKNETINPVINTYIMNWPTDSDYYYDKVDDDFAVWVKTATSTEGNEQYFKYYSGWGQMKTCTDISDIDTCEE